MDRDRIILNCKCGRQMLLDDKGFDWSSYKNYVVGRFYCANCGNELYLNLHKDLNIQG